MDFELNEEPKMGRQAVHDCCVQEILPVAAEMDTSAELKTELLEKMARLCLLGLNIPEEYGGAGVDAISAAIAIEELGWACGGPAWSVAAHNGLGCAPIARFGSEAQKRRWLPNRAAGKGGLGCLALTEPGAGSDLVGGVTTHAHLEADEWVIQGSKAWITNPSVASLVITLCRTEEGGGSGSLSLIVVPPTATALP